MLFRKLSTCWKNDRSPRLTVTATVGAKRSHTFRQSYCKTCAVQPGEISTSYYVTFRFDSGEQLELSVPAETFDSLIEGDRGQFSFQGMKYLGFERTI